jgi:protein-disulfide isomerase
MTKRPASSAPSAPPRAAFAASLALALAGLVLAAMLVGVHRDAAAGLTSFCTISEEINCDKVALSSWSVLFGVPVAAWGVLGYALAAALAAWGLMSRRLHPRWPAGLLAAFGLLATAGALGLAWVSKAIIGAWCLLCMGSWAASLGLLVTGWLATRPAGVAEAIRADLKALGRYPRRVAAVLMVGVAALALLVTNYSRLETRRQAPPSGATPNRVELPLSMAPAKGPAILFSDYDCPFCGIAHAELKETLRVRPDIQVVRRHFPLDQACNPMLKRPMHVGACEKARAAICAEAQGRLEDMDDALFASQKEPATNLELAARLRLDLGRFKACLVAPSTEGRLTADIQAGIAAKLRSTPTFVVDGTLHEGKLPIERFPPPSRFR